MNIYPPTTRTRTGKLAALFAFLIAVSATTAFAQQKVSRNFPAGKNVRLELKNLSGTITVETWPKDEIRITATMESPVAHFNPRQTDAGRLTSATFRATSCGRTSRPQATSRCRELTRPAFLPQTRPAIFSSTENLLRAAPMNSSRGREISLCSFLPIADFIWWQPRPPKKFLWVDFGTTA